MKSKTARTRAGQLSDRRGRVGKETVRKIAKKCVYVIRGCLREEEWLDAEEEFARIIATEINLLSTNR